MAAASAAVSTSAALSSGREGISPYSDAFYRRQSGGSLASARIVLPLVFSVVEASSVIDVGCGIGTWLKAARELGAGRTLGVEGSWVDSVRRDASIDIRQRDLETPLELGERFDLAICLEVAEHLSPARAEGFVADLCRLAPHVLFSAAIPDQGGTSHVNERWQSYWASLFAAQGYGARDVVRDRVWWNPRVSYWYSQNALLYSRGQPASNSRLDRAHPSHTFSPKRWLNKARAALRPV